jgi:hypothetical protein
MAVNRIKGSYLRRLDLLKIIKLQDGKRYCGVYSKDRTALRKYLKHKNEGNQRRREVY